MRRLLSDDDGSLTTEIYITIESSDSRTGRTEVPVKIPLLEAQHRADAVAPGALVGAEISKNFDGLWYKGRVRSYDKKAAYYYIKYDDGDNEEMTTGTVLEYLMKRLDQDKEET